METIIKINPDIKYGNYNGLDDTEQETKYREIARKDYERELYEQCDKEDMEEMTAKRRWHMKHIMKYMVKNTYSIQGESSHRTPEAALKAASKREGEGWTVQDSDNNRWDFDFDGNAVISESSSQTTNRPLWGQGEIMEVFKYYEDAMESDDIDKLVEYCKEGVVENNKYYDNGADFLDWDDGQHIAGVYLENNEFYRDDGHIKSEVDHKLDLWINTKK